MKNEMFPQEGEVKWGEDAYFFRIWDGACMFHSRQKWQDEKELFSVARNFVERYRLGKTVEVAPGDFENQTVVFYPTMLLNFEEWREEKYKERGEYRYETVLLCEWYVEVDTHTLECKIIPESEGKKRMKSQEIAPKKIMVDSEKYFCAVEAEVRLSTLQKDIDDAAQACGWHGPAHADFFNMLGLLQARQREECATRARELLDLVDAPYVDVVENALKSGILRVY